MVFNPGVFTQTVTLSTLTDVAVEGNEYLVAVLSTTDSRIDIFAREANVTITEESMYVIRTYYINSK